jgi:hypothetical protein
MNPQETFDILDNTKGAHRYIQILTNPETHKLERTSLIKRMEKDNINKNQFYNITKQLKQIKIIEENIKIIEGKRNTFTKLTPKGEKIGEALNQLIKSMEE